ncbi:MAG: hypothetical protein IJO32_07185 [Bacilli bacterium]|nr:hypothetical protein [Bacilli bacterium]
MFDVGSIVINKNLVFKEKGELDHAYKNGRPCLVIALDEENYYYLSISRTVKSTEKTSIDLPDFKKKSSPSFRNVFKAPLCWKDEKGKVPIKTMLTIYKEFVKYYSKREKCEYYDEVIEYINKYIKENEKNIH